MQKSTLAFSRENACMHVCVLCVCVYPERYSPGALSDERRFGRLFKVAVGGRVIGLSESRIQFTDT